MIRDIVTLHWLVFERKLFPKFEVFQVLEEREVGNGTVGEKVK